MKPFLYTLLAGSLMTAWGADGALTVTAASSSAEPSEDTGVVMLPGAPVHRAAPPKPEPAPPDPPPPATERPKVALPDAFKADSSLYLQGFIGTWKKADADQLLGGPTRQRPVYDIKGIHGQIYAYGDPSDRYKELELDFDTDTGSLRTVFAYPKQMTWDDCRKLWGATVNTTHTKNGRSFYSYLNRKLDVLVDGGGKVISLGLY